MSKIRIPRFVYFLVIGIGTDLVLLFIAVAALYPTGIFQRSNSVFLIGLLTYFALKYTLFTSLFSRWGDKNSLTRFLGFMPGRVLGLFVGGYLGYRFSGAWAAVIAAVLFYFLGRWFGIQVSSKVVQLVEKVFEIGGQVRDSEPERFELGPKRRLFLGALIISASILLMISSISMERMGISFETYPRAIPILRIVIIIFSIVPIGLIWFSRSRRAIHFQNSDQATDRTTNPLYLLGLSYSIIPTIGGFILFSMGGGSADGIRFGLLSILMVVVWLRYSDSILQPQE